MDEIDRELMRAESDALSGRGPPTHHRASNEIERVVSASSVLTASSTDSHVVSHRRPITMSRVPTSRDLERHPTELSRIHTALSQHNSTVGRPLNYKDSGKPLPAFGGGKPLPPQLPDREAYVVEFDGPDDPFHPQNWPLKKK